MSQQTLRCLAEVGVKTVDVSGRGGTNFIQIEDQRHETPQFQALYQYGQTMAKIRNASYIRFRNGHRPPYNVPYRSDHHSGCAFFPSDEAGKNGRAKE